MDVAGRAVELGITEGEDAPVRGHQPVALVVGRDGHRDDRPVERVAGQVAEELGIAEGVDTAGGVGQPGAVAPAGHPLVDGPAEGSGHLGLTRVIEVQTPSRRVTHVGPGADIAEVLGDAFARHIRR